MSGATLVVALVMQISQWGESTRRPLSVVLPSECALVLLVERMQESVEICGLSDMY